MKIRRVILPPPKSSLTGEKNGNTDPKMNKSAGNAGCFTTILKIKTTTEHNFTVGLFVIHDHLREVSPLLDATSVARDGNEIKIATSRCNQHQNSNQYTADHICPAASTIRH